MHLENDELFALANAEYIGIILEDIQKKQKEHLAKCRECYRKFCIYITMLDLMGNGQEEDIYEDEALELNETDAKKENFGKLENNMQMQNVILQIHVAGALLSSVQTVMKEVSSYWNFIHMPQEVAARGSSKKEEIDIYTSMESEYSQIRHEAQRLIIQLDDEVFPVKLLRVRYNDNEGTVIRKFEYNEETECYEVVINQNDINNTLLVEIVKL